MATNKWVGAFLGIFDSASNWSLGHVLKIDEDAVIDTGSTHAYVAVDTDADVNSISLGSNDVLQINGGVTFYAENGTGPNVNNGTINVASGGTMWILNNTGGVNTF